MTPTGDFYLSIMETTEEIWNGLENLLDLVGQRCNVEITGFKVTMIKLAQ